MSDCPSSSDEIDRILASLFAECERAADREATIRTYRARYPQYAGAIREASELDRMLGLSNEVLDTPVPERLGDFKIVRQIAKGGMGIIYEAIQEPLDRRVVVKVIRRGAARALHRERFLREQRVLARLHQTHIVPVFASGEEGEIQYFAMPYIDGAALHHVVRATIDWQLRVPNQQTPPLSRFAEIARRRERRSEREAFNQEDAEPVLHRGETAVSPDGLCLAPEDTPPSGSDSLFLSSDYCRSVAQVMADVAESLEHAHQHGFIHRDIKPANIMIDLSGQSWVIDFGLAGYLNDPQRPARTEEFEEDAALLRTRQIGTPGYWSPEQRQGASLDQRTDVWGLGVTLYELLTLRPAVLTDSKRAEDDGKADCRPVRARRLVKNLPRDLDAICHKAMELAPEDRYETAQEFAEDLRRWLRGEPTSVYPESEPARTIHRVGLWARRNKGWASAGCVALLALSLLVILARVQVVAANRVAEAADRAAAAANREKKAAQRETAAFKRGLLIQEAQRLLAVEHTSGWSDQASSLARKAAQIRPGDETVRGLAATTLFGLDATCVKRFTHSGVERVLFDPQGRRLLMGSIYDRGGSPVVAKLWDSATDRVENLAAPSSGALAFGTGGTPLHLCVREERAVVASLEDPAVAVSMEPIEGAILGTVEEGVMSPDGRVVVMPVIAPGNTAMLAAWDGRSGNLLHTFPSATPFGEAGALAVAPDGSLLAEGDREGVIQVWSLVSGDTVASMRARASRIHCLSFARDFRKGNGEKSTCEGDGWLLAAGDGGGTITIWDLTRKAPISYCRGSYCDVFAVAFSSDGSTLASAGYADQRLWDVATGKLLLRTNLCICTSNLAFSPDGRMLATGHFRSEAYGSVWRLEPDRGVKTLRGLASQVSMVTISSDDRIVAALSRDWQVGIWNCDESRLLHVLNTPQGRYSDNAALALSPDGGQLAFSAGRDAKLWDVETGREIRSWQLGEGLVDRLVFPAADKLVSFRVETPDKDARPDSANAFTEYPRICRIRNLLGETGTAPLAEIDAFDRHVFSAAVSNDGTYFAVGGLSTSSGTLHLQKVFNDKGEEVCSIPTERHRAWSVFAFAATGTTLAALTNNEASEAALVEIPSGRRAGVLPFFPECITDKAALWARKSELADGTFKKLSIYREDRQDPVVSFATPFDVSVGLPAVNATGTRFVWGTSDGAVYVADMPEVKRRLEEFGLD